MSAGSVVDGDSFGTPVFTAAGATVGSHVITLSGLANDNYTVSFAPGTLTITKASLSVTADNKSKVYGQPNPALTGTVTGVKNADAISASFSTAATTLSPVGAYPIVPEVVASAAVLANYDTPVLTNGTLTVGKAPLTIAADNNTKVYGDPEPSLTYAITSGDLVGTDTVAGSLTRVAGENVGTYPIQQGSVSVSSNYELTFVQGSFTITPKKVKITADPKSKAFGASDPTLTFQVIAGSLQSGDLFSGSLARVAGESVGSYPIQQGTVSAGENYDLDYESANLTIGNWTVNGFYQPIGISNSIFQAANTAGAPAPTTGTVWQLAKGGSTIPLKFNVFAASLEKTAVSDLKSWAATRLSGCTTGAGDEAVEELSSAGSTTMRYDGVAGSGGQFIYNWKTAGVKSADECYRVAVTLQDDSVLYTFVKLRK